MRPVTFRFLPALLVCTCLTSSCSTGSRNSPPAVSAAPSTAVHSSAGSSDARRKAIVAFCAQSRGRKIGDGECWSLANEAFKQTGARRPGTDMRVWGRLLNLNRESPLPGDILECDHTRFADGTSVPAQHTAVIIGVHSASLVRIAEQNSGGKRKVTERDLDLSGVRGGSIFVYRP